MCPFVLCRKNCVCIQCSSQSHISVLFGTSKNREDNRRSAPNMTVQLFCEIAETNKLMRVGNRHNLFVFFGRQKECACRYHSFKHKVFPRVIHCFLANSFCSLFLKTQMQIVLSVQQTGLSIFRRIFLFNLNMW